MEATQGWSTETRKEKGKAMKWVKASEFKADCVQLMGETGVLVVLKNGRPLATLADIRTARKHAYFGMDKGKLRILGDIVSPTPELWNEDSR